MYGDSFADVYDDWYGEVSDVGTTVDVMVRLANRGAVLELGVGTGRLAIPLAAAGIAVTGIDASRAMLDRLAENDPGATVRAELGDMCDLRHNAAFSAAFVAYNTLFNAADHGAQARCFSSVARALNPGGHFVVEAFVPELDDAATDRSIGTTQVRDGRVVLSVTMRDASTQIVRGQHIELTSDGEVKLRPWAIRYSTILELDQMASSAGFTVADRWSDWSGEPFSEDSQRHVSVYRLRKSP